MLEPALDVLHRALHGDEGARSFLDRTSSIYVLDATDLSKPHTYGCWNFIHQAMNEVERAEANHLLRQNNAHDHQPLVQQQQQQSSFVAHAQLLATMALRVARRSNAVDQRLVATCIENAPSKDHHDGKSKNANVEEAHQKKLIEINVEIRDIVIGRMAALALDPSYHRNTSTSNNSKMDTAFLQPTSSSPSSSSSSANSNSNSNNYVSAFSDTVVLETFCAVLAANAVSNGPAAVRHLVSEWIVPSSQHLPPFCLTCITLHLAKEASCQRLAPAGIQNALQQLSTVVMAGVLAPVLTDAIKESSANGYASTYKTASTSFLSNGLSVKEMNDRIAALSLRAMNQWCAVTDLSLAQIKHICTKVRINIVDTFNDAMYSDSRLVLDALAECLESVMERHQVATVSEQRMTQVRYIMQVDEEEFFRSNITAEQLVAIESKEMAVILEELVSSIGIQRFRFADRQASGDGEVCRNLARMAASVCDACRGVSTEARPVKIGPGLLDLLLKAASHPSVDISGIALEALAEEVSAETGLVHQLLPILQGRAITPHKFVDGQTPSLLPENGADGFTAFDQFRNTALLECLQVCWKVQPQMYLTSCAAAIEEFCREGSSAQVSFHLEAALFCVGAVAEQEEALRNSSSTGMDQSDAAAAAAAGSLTHLGNCMTALSSKPQSLLSNPLTLAQACRFVGKYAKWVAASSTDVLDKAADLCLSTFGLCASAFPYESAAVEMRQEGNISPYSNAANALRSLLVLAPSHFVSNQAITVLGAGWEASYAAANRTDILTVDDREAMAVGLCHVLASLPESQRAKSLLALAMPALDCLEAMLRHANEEAALIAQHNGSNQRLDAVLDRLASEIVMVATITTSFSNALQAGEQRDSAAATTTMSNRATVREPALTILKRTWPSISTVATQFNNRVSVSEALQVFLTRCLPPGSSSSNSTDELASSLLEELCQLAISMVEYKKATTEEEWNFGPVVEFIRTMTEIHGKDIDRYALLSLKGETTRGDEAEERARRMGQALESVLLTTTEGVQSLLGPTWTNAQRQGNGQPAFESKSQLADQGSSHQVSRAALAPMLSLLQTCAEHCPIFLLHLPAAKGQDRNEDLLVRRAVESAISSILDPDVDTSTACMAYLESNLQMATVAQSSSSEDPAATAMIRQSLEEILSPIRREMLNCVLVGICGKFGTSSNLESAAKLLHSLLGTYSTNMDDGRTSITTAFSRTAKNEHPFFLLGPRAQSIVMECLFKTCQQRVPVGQLEEFVEQIWDLHHSDSAAALTDSDAVGRFCQRYST